MYYHFQRRILHEKEQQLQSDVPQPRTRHNAVLSACRCRGILPVFYTVLFQEDLSGILRRKAAGRYFSQQSGYAPTEDSVANHSDAAVSGSGTRHAVAGENQTESSEKQKKYTDTAALCAA